MTQPPSAPAHPAPHAATPPRKRWPLHTRILLGLIVGAALGLAANALAHRPLAPQAAGPLDLVSGWLQQPLDQENSSAGSRLDFLALQIADPLGRVFLRLVLMVVVPLVVSALALGVLELGDVRRLGRVGLRTLGYTLLLSGCAVAIGLGMVNLIGPGRSLADQQRALLIEQYGKQGQEASASVKPAKPLSRMLLDIIPENPLQEAVGALDGSSPGNGMLSVMFFALVLGVALSMAGPRAQAVARLLEGIFDVTMVVIGWAMQIAPFGVACLVFSITARLGTDILHTLFWFVLTALGGMALQMLVVYSLAVRVLGQRSPPAFFRDIRDVILTAFGTSSSNATLPTALRVAKDELRLPPEISQFVLTIGSTGNQNGTALYEGVVVLFLAQVFGVHLALHQQLTVVLMSVLAGVGTAGVPGGSIPLIMIVLKSVGVPPEGIGIILGIDRVLDMCRTVLNVSGDLVLATCVARGESADRPRLTPPSGPSILV